MRPPTEGDADALLAAYLHNREHMRPTDPHRDEHFFTVEGQRDRLRTQLAERDAGRLVPWVLVDGPRVVGWAMLSGIVHGPFCSAVLGYWTDIDYGGKGLASAAVEAACRYAAEALGLHRVEAGTLVDNVRSQRVLAKCGFEYYGVAPRYLHINGEWRDHRLFQRILHDRSPHL